MAPSIYNYVRHPRAHELHQSAPPKTTEIRGVEHDSFWVRLNAKLGLKVTLAVGSMWAAYVFAALALFALPDALKQGTYFIVVWLSSSFLQLVLLPIIIVGQNIQARAADKRAENTYANAVAVLHEAKEIQHHLLAQDDLLLELIAKAPVPKPHKAVAKAKSPVKKANPAPRKTPTKRTAAP